VVLDAVSSGHDVLHVRVVRLLAVIIVITAGPGSGPLRTLLSPLLTTLGILRGALDGDAGWHRLAAARGCFHAT
jgi:hypothetical protein